VNDTRSGNGGIPVRTWRDLWAFVLVIAMIVGSFTVLQVQSMQHTVEIQEIKAEAIRRDTFDARMDAVEKRLDRIESKIDAESEARHSR
jgi:hypothetical protein